MPFNSVTFAVLVVSHTRVCAGYLQQPWVVGTIVYNARMGHTVLLAKKDILCLAQLHSVYQTQKPLAQLTEERSHLVVK